MTCPHINCVKLYQHLLTNTGHVDIQSLRQILGYENIATTEIYTHINDGQLQAAINSNPLSMMFS